MILKRKKIRKRKMKKQINNISKEMKNKTRKENLYKEMKKSLNLIWEMKSYIIINEEVNHYE